MSVAEIPWVKPASVRIAERERIASFVLAGLLIAFTLTAQDGGEASSRIISAVLFAFTALFFVWRPHTSLVFTLPAVCLLAMAGFGLIQTVLIRQKPVYEAWGGVLFWFAAACIALLASQIFRDGRRAALFRHIFVYFGSALCVLELLEQASKTHEYFWFIPSKYPAVYGSFAYWNNFAEFVEILLPVTLWAGLMRRKPEPGFLLLAALQIGAVAASGSRAGAALVLVELVASLVIVYARNRNQTFLYAALSTVVLSAVFVYAAGVSQVMQKLHQRDQLSVRRDINISSLAMIAERPFTGWGMDSYVSIYPMFARYDAGNFVNRAHNDWLQWTAEGGVFFSGLMLAVLVWSMKPAIRSVWGLGLVAVCVHALVDYPFARLGVCGWYFGLVGMLAVWQEKEKRTRPESRRSGRH